MRLPVLSIPTSRFVHSNFPFCPSRLICIRETKRNKIRKGPPRNERVKTPNNKWGSFNSRQTKALRAVLILLLALGAALPASARIRYCSKNGRPYSTTHGYYVDVPGTRQYVKPSRRPRRPSRSSRSSSYPYVRR